MLSTWFLQSVSEARLLLRDWLVIFTANYHRNSFMRASAAQLLQLPVRQRHLQLQVNALRVVWNCSHVLHKLAARCLSAAPCCMWMCSSVEQCQHVLHTNWSAHKVSRLLDGWHNTTHMPWHGISLCIIFDLLRMAAFECYQPPSHSKWLCIVP